MITKRGKLKKTSECVLWVDTPVCSSDYVVTKIATKLNKNTGPRLDPTEIIEDAKIRTACETESCAVQRLAKTDKELYSVVSTDLKTRFKLPGAVKIEGASQTLLTNSHIDSFLEQLTDKYKKLKHLKFHMLNFDTHDAGRELNNLNLLNDVINKGYDSFCVVLNTDQYGNGGIHWFCIYCDFRTAGTAQYPFTIEYFNSSGREPYKSVAEWMVKNKIAIENSPKKYVVNDKVNSKPRIVHQTDTDTECGVYCLFYIYKRASGKSADYFKTKVSDARMTEFRDKIFADAKKYNK